MRPRLPSGRPMPRKLRRRILGQIETALANVDAALAGGMFRSDDERHASLAVLRIAPRLFRPATHADDEAAARAKQPLCHPRWTEAEENDLLERLEVGETREESAEI